MLRERMAGMARHRELDLADVAMHVITAPTLRLDHDPNRSRLLETAKRLRPRLVLLDPLVRLHGIDENNAGGGRRSSFGLRLQHQFCRSSVGARRASSARLVSRNAFQ